MKCDFSFGALEEGCVYEQIYGSITVHFSVIWFYRFYCTAEDYCFSNQQNGNQNQNSLSSKRFLDL